MTRRMLASAAVALGAALAMGGSANAAEPEKSGVSGFTMTLGGKGTIAQAASATDDVEEARGYRGGYRGGFYGGYRGFYGRGFYGGYRGFYGGGYGFYRPYFYRPFYRPFFASYYYPYSYGYSYPYTFYQPYLYGGIGYNSYSGFGGGFCIGINGNADDVTAPAVTLNLAAAAKTPVMSAPVPTQALPSDGTFRYDGGPANPVPQPKPDMNPQSTSAPTAPGLPVSLKKPTSPYTYKAYGEK